MSNDSSTGGPLVAALPSYPGGLTYQQFVQSVFAGIAGLDGTLVRPGWQHDMPQTPDIDISWIALNIGDDQDDANVYSAYDAFGNFITQDHSEVTISVRTYGPVAHELTRVIRAGFKIPQNLETLATARMAFKECGRATRMPDLVGERWRDSWIMPVVLRQQLLLQYPILSFVSGPGFSLTTCR